MIKMCRCLRGQCERSETVRSAFFALIPLLMFGAIFAAIEWQLDVRAWVLAHPPYGWLVVGAGVLGFILVFALVMWIACYHHESKPANTYFSRRDSRHLYDSSRWVHFLALKPRHQPKRR